MCEARPGAGGAVEVYRIRTGRGKIFGSNLRIGPFKPGFLPAVAGNRHLRGINPVFSA